MRSEFFKSHLHLVDVPGLSQHRLVIELVSLYDAVGVGVRWRLPGHLKRLGAQSDAPHVLGRHAGHCKTRIRHYSNSLSSSSSSSSSVERLTVLECLGGYLLGHGSRADLVVRLDDQGVPRVGSQARET